MRSAVLNLYKEIGETPLARIKRFRADNSEYGKSKMSYAGRLDPMAEGVLVVLVEGENKNREKYLGFSKKYTAEVLFGTTTDTYDILGKIVKVRGISEPIEKIRDSIENLLSSFVGVRNQKYPAYSSKKVEGKSLFEWARDGKIHEIDIPEREIEIFSIEVLKWHTLPQSDLLSQVNDRIGLVEGDFRQSEILAGWKENISKKKNKFFPIATIDISCGSGTYIRVLAHELGRELRTGALVFSLKRTCVGEYDIRDSIHCSVCS